MSKEQARSRAGLWIGHANHGLFAKFLLVLVPVFLALAVPGLTLLLRFELRDQQDALAARVGNQAARVAAAFARHDTSSNPRLAQDLLEPLAADRAFLCAEIRTGDGAQVLHAAPPNVGCKGQNSALAMTIPIGDRQETTLNLQLTDAEIIAAKKFQRSMIFSVISAAFLIAVIAASFGFRTIVARPLEQLLAAIRRNAEKGERIIVETSRRDELATVILAFNEMLSRESERERALERANELLRETQSQYETLNEELEKRVRSRTSELKRREIALLQSERRFSDFANASSDWYWEMDENLRFSYFSDRFFEITGVAQAALLGKTRQETGIPNVDPDQWRRHLTALADHQPFRNFIHPRVKPDGTTVWLSINGVPHFDENGRFKGFRGTGQEITELVAARERAEKARADAETANLAKSQFLANMSHELRTPLNAIIGFSEAIENQLFGPINQKVYRDYAGFVRASGNHLLEIISDILDLAKVESGRDELNEETFDIHELANSTISMLQSRAKDGGVTLELDVASRLPNLSADRRKLKQVLVNLLSNAIKFTPAGGNVVLKIRHRSKDGFVFAVSDTGIGIARQDIPKALTPFQQIQHHLNRTYEGTGLGLPLSKAFVELHGGSLKIESEVGRGTTVTLRLPAYRTLRQAQNTSGPLKASGGMN